MLYFIPAGKTVCISLVFEDAFHTCASVLKLSIVFVMSLAEVTARNVKRSLQVQETGPDAPRWRQQKCDQDRPANAERDCHRRFARMGFSLPIPIRAVTHEVNNKVITTHWVKITDYCRYLLREEPGLIVGGPGEGLRNVLASFWEAYRSHHPTHEIYQNPERLPSTIPILLYGDEGKGPKRAGWMDFAFESPIGLDRVRTGQACSCKRELENGADFFLEPQTSPERENAHLLDLAASLTHNNSGHSYLKRYLVFGLPHAYCKEETHAAHVLTKHLELVVEDLQSFSTEGIKVSNEVFYGAFIGLKGDLRFHKDTTAGLTRSYANLGKTNYLMMCSYCHAGLQEYPFEESLEEPEWAQSLWKDRPWNEDERPVLASLAFDSARAEFFLKLDPFHVMKVGVSRDVCGSIIYALCRLGLFDAEGDLVNLKARLERAHGAFRLYCATHSKSPGLRSFKPAFFNAVKRSQSPWTNSKGSDTTLLLSWLQCWIQVLMQTEPRAQEHSGLLEVMLKLVTEILDMHALCQSHGLFLDWHCGRRLYARLMKIARLYQLAARKSLALQIVGFALKPKFHALKHVAYQLRQELFRSSTVTNPYIHNCEMNEDHVGHVSSLSRNVSVQTVCYRVIQRYFLKTHALIVDRRRKLRRCQ